MRHALIIALLGPLLAACEPAPSARDEPPRELRPVPNLFGPGEALWSPQPHRDRPTAVVASSSGQTLYVALAGTESDYGREVAVVDARTLETSDRIRVGPGPTALALHPDGRHLAVVNRYARYASIVDVVTRRVVAEVPTPYYAEGIAFTPDGRRAYLSNRWKDSVLRWDLEAEAGRLRVRPHERLEAPDQPIGIPVAANPRRIVVTPDGSRVLVASETGLALTAIDPATDAVVAVHRPNSPVIDVAVIGAFAYVLHIGGGTNHPPDDGVDGDEDGAPGDATANVQFQDVQNEIDVLALPDLRLLHRYTSDTICCRDFRDVDPDRPEAGSVLPPADAWPASRAAFLPPRETWIVAGAMPERAVPITRPDGRPALAVVFGGSGEVQTFDVDPANGALTPRETAASGLHPTGFGPMDAVAIDGGSRLIVVDRLGETLTALDVHDPPVRDPQREVVGDASAGAFPATDAELGETFNTMTALFTVDGDQTCVHCHRDGAPIGKAISMPLLATPEWGLRLVMSYRGGFDGRPWFLEAGMDEENFFPVINEFARKENFCCEQTDTRVWSRYPTRDACTADPSLEGCGHVLDCVADPPAECATRTYGAAAPTRDRHFREAAMRVLGRDRTFGDALYRERVGPGGMIEREPLPLGFDGITRALGLFLLSAPRLPPNPNAAWPTVEARLGEVLYHSAATGCASCHPLPVGATARATLLTSAEGPISMPYVVTPVLHPVTGADVDRITAGFLQTFPDAEQTDVGLRVGVSTVRGAWDRARFLHHGRARSLREVLATPGHPVLDEGERGFNERFGQPDTHGGTSALSPEELDALVRFVETL